ncbi:MAG: hypothetical protein A2551_04490 [Elusimicrobia bacterium RIFOXYD2_FULL_34_30]|nr:MAG: hypothetical protein A2551_04490 [Elusimicrobia bacterium RIFOXYD2_FULL_34_30]
MTVTFIDVGQIGDSILIQTPSGKNILIDGGYEYAGEKKVYPLLLKKNVKKLDTVILTHPHDDHCGGLAYILKKLVISEVLDTGVASPSEPYRNFLMAVKKNGAKYRIASKGEEYDWGGSKAVVLNAKNENLYDKKAYNNHSIVIKLQHGKNTFLFSGDIEKEAEDCLIPMKIESMVLKIPHHGSSSSSTYKFLKKVNPQIAIITVGNPNDFGFPVEMTLKKLENLGIEIYRTDLNGDIEIKSNGKKIFVKTEKKYKSNKNLLKKASINENYWVHLENGWFFVRDNKFKKAIPELKEALSIYPDSSDAHSKLGYAYKKIKNILLAKEEFLKALSLNNKEYHSLYHLAMIYYSEGNIQDAKELLKKALEVNSHGQYTNLIKKKIREIEENRVADRD